VTSLSETVRSEWEQVLRASRSQPLAPAPDSAAEPAVADLLLAGTPETIGSSEYAAVTVSSSLTSSPSDLKQDVTGLLEALRSSSIGASELMSSVLQALELDDSGGVLRLIDGATEAAAASAERYRRNQPLPLDGIAFAVKDIMDVADTVVTSGSLQTGNRRASCDATIVARLRSAGAIPVAMSATTEFACGAPENRRYGTVRNPWDQTRWSGGSSSGSAALLAGRAVPLALGSDTGGSIRIPAAWCGVTGFKPTHGLIPRTGVTPLSWTLDHVGPMTRSVRDLELLLPLLAGPDGVDPLIAGPMLAAPDLQGLKGLQVGALGGWFADKCEPEVLAAWQQALELLRAAGAEVSPVDLGDLSLTQQEAYLLCYCELASLQESRSDTFELFDEGTQQRILRGQAASATDYLRALRRRSAVQQNVLAAMAGLDVMISPGTATEAASASQAHQRLYGSGTVLHGEQARNTMIFDYVGFPALMIPAGLGVSGLPVAIQIIAGPRADLTCLAVGAAFQDQTRHHLAMPPAQR
jgi:aspartyl-tRNA(Asn)/glutamyl-tRNA(Gln) amidotransferase subunit A